MPKVFVSHASADKYFTDHFVNTVLKLGCELSKAELVYTSGADTGVPSGEDLMAYLRREVHEAVLVVALISPMYQTRPTCLVELGAAWSIAEKLFPLLTPGLSHSQLAGVLPPMMIKHANDSRALNELHDTVGRAVGHTSSAQTWGDHLQEWLASVDRRAGRLQVPDLPTVAEWERLRLDLESAKRSIDGSAERIEGLEEQVARLRNAKTSQEVAEAILPVDERERFEKLTTDAMRSLGGLERVLAEAVIAEVVLGRHLEFPREDEDYSGNRDAIRLVADGELSEVDDEGRLWLSPDYSIPRIEEARKSLVQLREFLDSPSEEFATWFESEYGGLPLDLTKRAVQRRLLSF